MFLRRDRTQRQKNPWKVLAQLNWCRQKETWGKMTSDTRGCSLTFIGKIWHVIPIATYEHHTQNKQNYNKMNSRQNALSKLTSLRNRKCEQFHLSLFIHNTQKDVVMRGKWHLLGFKETLPHARMDEWANYCLFHLQTVANLSGCEPKNSEALVHCLRDKSKAEILAINQVGRIVWLGGASHQDMGLPVLTT